MKPHDAPHVAPWLALAASDLRVAEGVAKFETGEWHQVCFHCQQAAEKALKAMLEADDQPPPRTHDLVVLIDALTSSHPAIAQIAEAASILSVYGVGPRYPRFFGAQTEADARDALQQARCIVLWVEGAFGIGR